MKKLIDLGGCSWRMHECGVDTWHDAIIPGSVYADLLRDGSMEDPFWRENEFKSFELMKKDWEYARSFSVTADVLTHEHVLLRCEGLDTLAHVIVNGVEIGFASNMYITWEWDVKALLHEGENELRIRFDSPINYCAEAAERAPGWESSDGTPGFRHLRKAHCMFGWDWGPRLPDAGIWRGIQLVCWNTARVEDVLIQQTHEAGRVALHISLEIEGCAAWQAIITSPDGNVTTTAVTDAATVEIAIENPQLWWPHGYGEQPLYTVEVRLVSENTVIDVWKRRIGLRTLSVSREKDEWGEEFCHIVNGKKALPQNLCKRPIWCEMEMKRGGEQIF